VEQIPTHSLGRTPRWSRGKPEGGCDPVGTSAGAGFWQDLWGEERRLKEVCWWGL